jgi:hypothetical protein
MRVYPDKYSVYNRISDEGLNMLGRNTIKESDPFSKRYASLNAACQELSTEIKQPLYLIDSMFSLTVHGVDSPLTMTPGTRTVAHTGDENVPADNALPDAMEDSASFSLEKYLQEFIVSNWNKSPLGKMLDIYVEDEEKGVQFTTGVGEIDILARDRANGDWVILELKKGRSDDAVVGQIFTVYGLDSQTQGQRDREGEGDHHYRCAERQNQVRPARKRGHRILYL